MKPVLLRFGVAANGCCARTMRGRRSLNGSSPIRFLNSPWGRTQRVRSLLGRAKYLLGIALSGDAIRESLHEPGKEGLRILVPQLACVVEQILHVADIGFGLLQCGHIEEDEALPQRVIGPERAQLAIRA